MSLRRLLKDLCPPLVLKLLKKIIERKGLLFSGNYDSWESASAASSGYNSETVFLKVQSAALKVKKGEALFERDSTCFYQANFRWPTLACLLNVAAKYGGRLNVLDFGGSLGSFYFQHRKFFVGLNEVNWSIVEQRPFVEFGRSNLQTASLRFYPSIGECSIEKPIDVVLLSSVLQYIESFEELLREIAGTGAQYLLIDRTPFTDQTEDKLTIQQISRSTYEASFPTWLFSERKLIESIQGLGYQLYADFSCDEGTPEAFFKGFFFTKSSDSFQ